MMSRKLASGFFWYAVIVCGVTIGLSWMNEVCDFPRFLFGIAHEQDWRESALETFVILMLFIPLLVIWRRLQYVEQFLRVCAWCRKIEHQGRWMPLEEFFRKRFAVPTSHGMCADCSTKWLQSIT
jgi:hypothetical protein